MESHKIHVPNHQPDIYLGIGFFGEKYRKAPYLMVKTIVSSVPSKPIQ
jgi:hypothetical protein